MSEPTRDVVGIGNAIVDILGRCDDAFLDAQQLAKGHMQLVDADTVSRLYDAMGPAIEVSGGSAANTVVGVASLGGTAAYLGKVADDEFGRIFSHDLRAAGVSYDVPPKTGGAPTARSLVLVTPDGERTMNTFLGVSPDFEQSDLDDAVIASGQIVYLEGYLFDRPAAQAAIRKAARVAKAANRKVALTLSDGFCVDRHRDAFLDLIRSDVNILFANESELTSLMETEDFDAAVRAATPIVPFLAATQSEKGSSLITNGEIVRIEATPVAKVIDTTGAGDLYAAGVLYGLCNDFELSEIGRIGSIAAAEVISHLGARPETTLSELVRK